MSDQEPGYSELRPDRGAVVLVLGILSWVTGCFILGIVAWVMGNGDLQEMREGRMDPRGEGTTQAGRILGMIHVIVILLLAVALFGLMLLGVFAFGHYPAA